MDISIFELLFFVFIACAWPTSMIRMIRNKSTKGKSVVFSVLLLIGYVFGIGHKFLYDFDWVVVIYFFNALLILSDIVIYFVIRTRYEKELPDGL